MLPALIIVLSLSAASEAELRIEPQQEPGRVRVIALLSRAAGEISSNRLTLRLVQADGRPGPAIFGGYRREKHRLIFTPRYRLTPGQTYLATYRRTTGSSIQVRYQVPRLPPQAPAVVEKIYPSADQLPANHLKFYIYFSRPMRQGREVFEHFRLLDQQGHEIRDPWRRTELWTEDAQRLTLWIHPGRVKTGVNLRAELGPVLKPQRRYKLVVEQSLRDHRGQPLARPFEKQFTTSDDDRTRPLPQHWRMVAPQAGSRQALRIEFGEPLDRALLQRYLEVIGSDGSPVPGEIELGPEERSWQFTPAMPWNAEPYTLHVEGTLEDLAGNTPLRVFDRDLTRRPGETAELTLTFRPRSGSPSR